MSFCGYSSMESAEGGMPDALVPLPPMIEADACSSLSSSDAPRPPALDQGNSDMGKVT